MNDVLTNSAQIFRSADTFDANSIPISSPVDTCYSTAYYLGETSLRIGFQTTFFEMVRGGYPTCGTIMVVGGYTLQAVSQAVCAFVYPAKLFSAVLHKYSGTVDAFIVKNFDRLSVGTKNNEVGIVQKTALKRLGVFEHVQLNVGRSYNYLLDVTCVSNATASKEGLEILLQDIQRNYLPTYSDCQWLCNHYEIPFGAGISLEATTHVVNAQLLIGLNSFMQMILSDVTTSIKSFDETCFLPEDLVEKIPAFMAFCKNYIQFYDKKLLPAFAILIREDTEGFISDIYEGAEIIDGQDALLDLLHIRGSIAKSLEESSQHEVILACRKVASYFLILLKAAKNARVHLSMLEGSEKYQTSILQSIIDDIKLFYKAVGSFDNSVKRLATVDGIRIKK